MRVEVAPVQHRRGRQPVDFSQPGGRHSPAVDRHHPGQRRRRLNVRLVLADQHHVRRQVKLLQADQIDAELAGTHHQGFVQ